MTTLFENEQFSLELTGHDYDFVGIILTKTDEPLTFFFSEELCEHNIDNEDDWDGDDFDSWIDEDETKLLDVYEGLKDDEDDDEIQETIWHLGADSYFTTREDKSTGFLSCPKERGQFLALVKNYCPEQLANIPWA